MRKRAMGNTIAAGRHLIVVQSCDTEVANIGIFSKDKCTYHHVAIPSLEREWSAVKSTDLQPDEYDHILNQYRVEVLHTIKRLNER